MLYKGKKLEDCTKEELIEAIKVMWEYYENRIKDLKEVFKHA